MSFIFTESEYSPPFVFTDHVDVNGMLNLAIPSRRFEISSLPVVLAGDGGFTADPAGDGIEIVGGEVRVDIESLTLAT